MGLKRDIVITGSGVVSPIGVGIEAFAASLRARRSGVCRLDWYTDDRLPVPFGGAVVDFDAKQYVRPRKSLKVMSRDIQMAFAAADMAWAESGLSAQQVDPDRFGVVFGADMIPSDLEDLVPTYRAAMVDGRFDFSRWAGAIGEMFPLWMLKYLPNMPACHVAIAMDARGPNNSITMGDVSSLLAVCEAARVIERGMADVLVVGGFGGYLNPTTWICLERFELSRRSDEPERACRPFDAGRDGIVRGEGAAAMVFEDGRRAAGRGAAVLARVLGFACAHEPAGRERPPDGTAIRRAIAGALADAGMTPDEIGHVNAHGQSTTRDDAIEARAIRDLLGDVPVVAPKSYFGNLGAAGGAVEMIASLLALREGEVPPTLNYEAPDPNCPINVVHGQSFRPNHPTALLLNHTVFGQAVAVVIAAE